MNDEELKRCPFCGGEAEIKQSIIQTGDIFAECNSCGARSTNVTVSAYYCAADLVKEKWNKRATE